MSAFNAEKYIGRAITSILNQTYSNFEFIIINDGSTDKTAAVVRDFQDKRIILLDNAQNIGIPAARNKGIKIAKGEYIAVMDADDESFPKRFEMQVEFMQNHQDIGVLGAARFAISGASTTLWRPSFYHYQNLYDLLTHPCCVHPTTMLRRSTLLATDTKYDEDCKSAEDYKLWVDLAIKGVRFANLPTPLLSYYRHNCAVSISQKNLQDQFAKDIRQEYINYFFGVAVATKYSVQIQWLADRTITSKLSLQSLNTLYNAIDKTDKYKNRTLNIFFKGAITNKTRFLYLQLQPINPFLFYCFISSPIRKFAIGFWRRLINLL